MSLSRWYLESVTETHPLEVTQHHCFPTLAVSLDTGLKQSWVIEPASIPTHLGPGKELAHPGGGQEGHPDPRTPPALYQNAKAEIEYSNGQAAFNEEFHSPGLPGASPDSAALSMSLA